MEIYIELVIVLILMLMFIFWRLWFDFSKWRLLKKFKKEVDLNGKGNSSGTRESENRGITNTELRIEPAPINPNGFIQPERRELLQKADVSDVRENSTIPGKNGNKFRRFFGRRK